MSLSPFVVTIPPRRPDRFRAVLAPEQVERFERAIDEGRRLLDGRVVWNVNSTAKGGGVVELLRPLVGSLDVVDPAAAQAASRKSGYTLLMIDGAAEQLPDALVRRLAEGARVVTGTVDDGVTRLAFGVKAAGEVALLPLAEIGIPVLPEFAAPKSWSF